MLAIVIPYYKLLFFESTLVSLSNQTDKRFKVYIGNDASPHNPDAVIQKYADRLDIVYQKFDNNLGGASLVKQWNRCLQMIANEEWVMILGDDDVLDSHVVAAFYKNLEEIKPIAHVIRFATLKINEKGEATSQLYQNDKLESAVDFLFSGKRSSLSEYIFNRHQVFNIGFKDFPLAWHSDVLAVLEFSDFKNIFSTNDAVVKVRVSDSSISGSRDNFKLKSDATLKFYDYLLNQKGKYFNPSQKEELLQRFSKAYLNNKKALRFFFKISQAYIQSGHFSSYLAFLKKIIFSTLKFK